MASNDDVVPITPDFTALTALDSDVESKKGEALNNRVTEATQEHTQMKAKFEEAQKPYDTRREELYEQIEKIKNEISLLGSEERKKVESIELELRNASYAEAVATKAKQSYEDELARKEVEKVYQEVISSGQFSIPAVFDLFLTKRKINHEPTTNLLWKSEVHKELKNGLVVWKNARYHYGAPVRGNTYYLVTAGTSIVGKYRKYGSFININKTQLKHGSNVEWARLYDHAPKTIVEYCKVIQEIPLSAFLPYDLQDAKDRQLLQQ